MSRDHAAPHRVLIIGTGSIGERHLRCFAQAGRVELSLCEQNEALAQSVAARYDVNRVLRDIDNVRTEDYDAAVICTPAHLHVPMALRLASQDVGLLIEKPLSTNLDGVEALQSLEEEGQVRIAVAYVLRAHPLVLSLRAALQSDRFGRPLQVIVQCGQHFPTYRPAYRDIYYADRSRGGGAIQDALTHFVNVVEWCVGPVETVMADAAHLKLEGVTVEDTVHALARHRLAGHDSEVLASYTLNQHQAPNETTLTVVCERGTCCLEFHRGRWRSMKEPDAGWKTELEGTWERDEFFVAQADAFLDFLEGKSPPLCSLTEAVQTLRVNLALLQSVDTPAKVRVGEGR